VFNFTNFDLSVVIFGSVCGFRVLLFALYYISALSMASDGLRSVLVQHPAMKLAGRLAFGSDINDMWVDETTDDTNDNNKGNNNQASKQFRAVKGAGLSQKYNLSLRATVVDAVAAEAARSKADEGET